MAAAVGVAADTAAAVDIAATRRPLESRGFEDRIPGILPLIHKIFHGFTNGGPARNPSNTAA